MKGSFEWRGAGIGLGVVVLVAAAGCAKQPPRMAPVEPPVALEVPVPPPRVLAPVSEPEEPAAPAEPKQTPARPSRPRPASRPGSGGPDRPGDAQRPDSAPAGTGSDAARPASEPTAPALRTPQTANDAEADRRVRETLVRATRALDAINRASLSADAAAQYDTARRFTDQAKDALEARNYMFADYLADKAEALARGLTGR